MILTYRKGVPRLLTLVQVKKKPEVPPPGFPFSKKKRKRKGRYGRKPRPPDRPSLPRVHLQTGPQGLVHHHGFLTENSVRERCPFLTYVPGGTVKIYALIAPDDTVRYIGVTRKSLKTRHKQHLLNPTNNLMAIWVQDLQNSGLNSRIVQLTTVDEDSWEEREIGIIAWIRRFGRLLNKDPGGNFRDNERRIIPEKRTLVKRIKKIVKDLVIAPARPLAPPGLPGEQVGDDSDHVGSAQGLCTSTGGAGLPKPAKESQEGTGADTHGPAGVAQDTKGVSMYLHAPTRNQTAEDEGVRRPTSAGKADLGPGRVDSGTLSQAAGPPGPG